MLNYQRANSYFIISILISAVLLASVILRIYPNVLSSLILLAFGDQSKVHNITGHLSEWYYASSAQGHATFPRAPMQQEGCGKSFQVLKIMKICLTHQIRHSLAYLIGDELIMRDIPVYISTGTLQAYP